MYNVTVLGKTCSGKTAFCEQLSGSKFTTSYLKTIEVTPYYFPTMTIHDTPSGNRFGCNNDTLYEHTDLFLLIVNDDQTNSNIYNKIDKEWPNKEWILILNGGGAFHMRRRWALTKDIRVFQFDMKTDNGLTPILDYIYDLSIRELSAQPPVVDLRLGWEYLDALYSSCV